jgi:cell division protein FtsI (penicillin-binding protein 3)
MKTRAFKPMDKPLAPWRRLAVLAVFVSCVLVLSARAFDLQILRSDFFQRQGDARQLRIVAIPAHRGEILDRNGEPFAVSTPVSSVWINPQQALLDSSRLPQLAKLLQINSTTLVERIHKNRKREFMYLKRHVSPELAAAVTEINVAGVALQNEYKRYYPSGEVAANLIGFSDIDDNGQEGIELAYDSWLKGTPGKKKVIRDRLGRAFDDVERIRVVEPGKPIELSIDKRLQYLTYRTLKATVLKHNAVAGSAVVMDVHTGEVLAMVNLPSFNANDRSKLRVEAIRNRAVTDVFEPGSTMKPMSLAAALETSRWKPYYKVETAPGYMRVQGNMIRDTKNYGDLDVGGVIAKSSNVGISKIILAIDAEQQWDMYQKFGFGHDTGSGYPGEASGHTSLSALQNDFERASMAFGYGISVTPLQLVRAYAALADDGVIKPVSFLKLDKHTAVEGERIMRIETARAIRKMMQKVVSDDGTGKLAQVANYSVAGKTGTVHKFVTGGYAEDRYLSVFAGMVPADEPELAMVVMLDEPRKGQHFGGQVAAPVFSTVMSGAMRLFDVPPDNIAKQRLVLNPEKINRPGGEA